MPAKGFSIATGFSFLLALCAPLATAGAAEGGFKPLFDGKSLDGWKGKAGLWSVKDGAIAGSTGPDGIKGNTFLVSEGQYENFVLRLRFKFSGTGNSGIQFRSEQVEKPEDFVIKGYQADIGEGYYGSLYDERRRGMLAEARKDWVARFVEKDEWNTYEISAIGNQITLRLNDLTTVRFTEKDDAIPRRGVIALQLHGGPAMEIHFKDIAIREIEPRKLLYVTTSAGFRHSSLPLSRQVIEKLGRDSGRFKAVTTESVELITPRGLEGFDAVAFYTTGDLRQFPLSEENRNALIQWVKDGGAFAGFHSATDTYKDWEPYYEMIGGSFDGHPWHEEVKIDVEDPSHPAALHLGDSWTITDEIYQFKNYSRDRIHVILSLNPESVKGKGKRQDGDYAVAWCRDYGKGKVFYTSLGHREDVWENPVYQQHVLGGLLWAMDVEGYEGNATPGLPKPSNDWVPLFDGKTLSGWIPLHDGKWDVLEGGVLRGSGGQGHIFSPKEYSNFHYKAEVKVLEDSNSGMYFRTRLDERKRWPDGLEAQVNSSHGDPVRSGSLYGIVRVLEQLAAPGEWFTQEIIARGEHIVIKVNGRITAKARVPFDLRRHFPSGRFAFQQHHVGSEVFFRNVMVRELPEASRKS
jgi:type 1 glutamine amidotransferase